MWPCHNEETGERKERRMELALCWSNITPPQCYLRTHFKCSSLAHPSLCSIDLKHCSYESLPPLHLVTSLTYFSTLSWQPLCVHWLKTGTCNKPPVFALLTFPFSFFLPGSQAAVSGQPCTSGSAAKRTTLARECTLWHVCEQHTVPPCTRSQADSKAVNHDGLGNVCFSTATTWK